MLSAAGTLLPVFSSLAESEILYDEHIRPILETSCYRCHGEEKQKGNLRLDSPAGIRKGGDSGEPLFVAGKHAESYLYKLVSREDPDEAMPPKQKDALAKEDVVRVGKLSAPAEVFDRPRVLLIRVLERFELPA